MTAHHLPLATRSKSPACGGGAPAAAGRGPHAPLLSLRSSLLISSPEKEKEKVKNRKTNLLGGFDTPHPIRHPGSAAMRLY
jgi:hypothetical protein